MLCSPFMAHGAGISQSTCLAETSGVLAPACTANDVIISQVSLVGGPQACQAGSILAVDLEIRIETLLARYDIGIWINQEGGSARSDELNSCFHDALVPVASPSSACNHASQDPGLLAYYDGDADACGDVYAVGANPCGNAIVESCSGGSCLVTRRFVQIEVLCRDSDGDNVADVSACASWDNNDDTQCTGIADAYPETGSKCSCSESVPIQNLFVATPQELLFLNGFEDPD